MATGTSGETMLPITNDSEEMKLFAAFPDERKAETPLSPVELQRVEDLLRTYMRDSSKRALPSKAQLSAFTSSLFESGARKLSPKWNKTQLTAGILASLVGCGERLA